MAKELTTFDSRPMTKTEKRFFDGDGEKFLKDGTTVRCHAVSKSRLRAARAEYAKEYGEEAALALTPDDFWPDAQCTRGAIDGTTLCKFHGGMNPNTPVRQMTEFMPIRLQEIARTFEQNPELYTRFSDMQQLMTRNAQLYMSLETGGGGDQMLEEIWEAVEEIKQGNIADGVKRIENAMMDVSHEREVWDEVRENMKLINTLHKTQFTTEKELQTMATTDQIVAMVNNIYGAVVNTVSDLVKDRLLAEQIIHRIAAEIRKSSGTRSGPVRAEATIIDQEG